MIEPARCMRPISSTRPNHNPKTAAAPPCCAALHSRVLRRYLLIRPEPTKHEYEEWCARGIRGRAYCDVVSWFVLKCTPTNVRTGSVCTSD